MPAQPVRTQRREEIIQEIICILAGVHAGPVDKAKLGAAVRQRVTNLEHNSRKFFERSAIQSTTDKAKKLASAIDKLQKQIKTATPELQARMEFDFRKPDFIPSLDELYKVCVTAIKNSPKSDKVKECSAREAFALVADCTAKVPTSGSANSPFRATASLLYTILVGDRRGGRVWDLRRACNEILAPWHNMERDRRQQKRR